MERPLGGGDMQCHVRGWKNPFSSLIYTPKRKWVNWYVKNRHIQWWIALSFCCKVSNMNPYHPVPSIFTFHPQLSAKTSLQTNFFMIHGELGLVLGVVAAGQVWPQKDPCPREVFIFETSSKEFWGNRRPQLSAELNLNPWAEPRWHLETSWWMLNFSALSTFELHASLVALSLVSFN